MIKNIVFDFGDVLIDWNHERVLREFINDEEAIKILKKEIYKSEEWKKLDKGIIELDKAIENIKKRVPNHLKYVIEDIMYNFPKYFKLNDELCKNIIKLKENGYNIYVLSNTHIATYEEIKRRYIGKYFDGYIISAIEKCMKPDIKIYEKLLEKYNLKPNETFFIDDKEENILAAKSLGINGYVFNMHEQSIEELLEELRKKNIDI